MDPVTAATPTAEAPPVELAWGEEPAAQQLAAAASWWRVAGLAAGIITAGAVLVGGTWDWSHAHSVDQFTTEHALIGPDDVFADHDVDVIIGIPNTVKANAA